MDELSIYNRALSAEEIQLIYNAGSSGKCAATRQLPGREASGDHTALTAAKDYYISLDVGPAVLPPSPLLRNHHRSLIGR